MEESGSEGGSGNSRRRNDGEEETKEAIWSASAAEANGVGQMKVTTQPREASDSARRRKFKRCPMPAHGRKATYGTSAPDIAGAMIDLPALALATKIAWVTTSTSSFSILSVRE